MISFQPKIDTVRTKFVPHFLLLLRSTFFWSFISHNFPFRHFQLKNFFSVQRSIACFSYYYFSVYFGILYIIGIECILLMATSIILAIHFNHVCMRIICSSRRCINMISIHIPMLQTSKYVKWFVDHNLLVHIFKLMERWETKKKNLCKDCTPKTNATTSKPVRQKNSPTAELAIFLLVVEL